MKAIRQIVEVKNHNLTISLPENFNYQHVEIIILPSEQDDELPQWQVEEVQKRYQEYLKNPTNVLTEKEFFNKIENLL
jgi:hypothetical protein